MAWLDCAALGLGRDPSALFLELGRVAVSPGHFYGDAGDGFVRLNFAGEHLVLERAIKQIGQAVRSANQQPPKEL